MSGGQGRTGQASRSVFVGNIPYNATEDQLEEIFRTVGQVVSFRLVKNSDTGQPKGFGFCEFRDAQTAESAIRNLNNTELNGRLLRIDYASNIGEGKEKGSGGSGGGPGIKQIVNIQEQVQGVVENMSEVQMYEVMGQLKSIVAQNREQARELLVQHPQLSLAVLRMQDQLLKPKMPPPPDHPPPPPPPGEARDRRGMGMDVGQGPGRGVSSHMQGGAGGMGPGLGTGSGNRGGHGGMGSGNMGPAGLGGRNSGGQRDMRDMGGPREMIPNPRDMGLGPMRDMPPGGLRDMGPGREMGHNNFPLDMRGPPGQEMRGPRDMIGGPSGRPNGPPPGNFGGMPSLPPGLAGASNLQGQNLDQMLANLSPEQRQQFKQLINLPPEAIQGVPETIRNQILTLQGQMRGGRH